MFGPGTQELVILLVIVRVIFGAGKLPQIGGALGKVIRDFKKGMDHDDEDDQKPKQDEIGRKDRLPGPNEHGHRHNGHLTKPPQVLT